VFRAFRRFLDLFGRFTPTSVTCRSFSIPAPSLGFTPSESVLAVSRTPLGLPCPSFPSSLRLGIKASPLFLLFASDVALYVRLETSSFRASTASLAVPGSASYASASLQILPPSLLRARKRVCRRCHSYVACTVRKTPVSLPERASLELASLRVA